MHTRVGARVLYPQALCISAGQINLKGLAEQST